MHYIMGKRYNTKNIQNTLHNVKEIKIKKQSVSD